MMRASYRKAKEIIKKYGTGYYRATFLFPKEIRQATWIYYQFVRTADEFVDNASVEDHKGALFRFEEEWHKAETGESTTPFFNEYKTILKKYAIPHEYNKSFLKAMEQDLVITRYHTYQDLEKYMYGSATVVGYTMSHIIGYKEGALPYAKALAEAFQMTNFLRDIKEDYDERGRIYIPQEDMDRFGVTEQHLREGIVDENWKALMRFEIERTRVLYEKGVRGITYLHRDGQKAVYAAALIYNDILNKMEKNDYDIFSKRIVVSPFRKTVLLLKALCKRNR